MLSKQIIGPVEQYAGRDIHIHHWGEATQPPSPEAGLVCPQCRLLTWRYTAHCVHCRLDLVQWHRRWRLREVIRVMRLMVQVLGRFTC